MLLRGLEKAPAPEPKMGAMCYEPIGRPDRVEYVCPTCGEKTLYTNDVARQVSWELEGCRREMKEIGKAAGASIVLDESNLCRKCKPNAEKQTLQLVVTHEDGTSCTTSVVSQEDLRKLRDFLKGKLSYTTFNDGEAPLRSDAGRLQELLGIKSAP